MIIIQNTMYTQHHVLFDISCIYIHLSKSLSLYNMYVYTYIWLYIYIYVKREREIYIWKKFVDFLTCWLDCFAPNNIFRLCAPKFRMFAPSELSFYLIIIQNTMYTQYHVLFVISCIYMYLFRYLCLYNTYIFIYLLFF